MRILSVLALAAMSVAPAITQRHEPRLAGFPGSPLWQNQPVSWKLDGSRLIISAGRKTDWFAWPGGGYRADASPRLLFKAAADFMLSAKVTTIAHKTYDAGCLALFGSPTNWAKFCLEAQGDGQLAVISVVTRGLSDDVTSFSVEGTSTWLKLAKTDRAIMFYSSADGKNWKIVRKFHLESISGFMVGFSAQSPDGEGATAIFENAQYASGRVNLWKLR